jgi:hypothetical protein
LLGYATHYFSFLLFNIIFLAKIYKSLQVLLPALLTFLFSLVKSIMELKTIFENCDLELEIKSCSFLPVTKSQESDALTD